MLELIFMSFLIIHYDKTTGIDEQNYLKIKFKKVCEFPIHSSMVCINWFHIVTKSSGWSNHYMKEEFLRLEPVYQ